MSLHPKHEPVAYLFFAAAAAAELMRYVHVPAVQAVLGVVLVIAAAVRHYVTPDAHITEMTPEEWLDEGIRMNMPESVGPEDGHAVSE